MLYYKQRERMDRIQANPSKGSKENKARREAVFGDIDLRRRTKRKRRRKAKLNCRTK